MSSRSQQNVRFKLRVIKMENEEEKNTSKQFLWIKLVWKYYFLVEVIEKEKGNLGHVAQIHVCRQISIMTSLRTQTAYFCKIRLRSQANIDQHYPKNAFIGVTSFNIFMLQKKRKRNNEIARVLHFNKSTKLLFFYLPKVMRCFKQNERIRCKKYDPARTRT